MSKASRAVKSQYDYIVLGAGVAGLSAAYKLSQGGKTVLVLEKARDVGGLARTLNINGFRFDYCAHRFHSPDRELMEEIKRVMAPNFQQHRQKSRIHMFGRYLKYPFEVPNLLRAMPKLEALRCGIDFGLNTATSRFRRRQALNYRDWFVQFFGKRLYTVMCEMYTRKIWGMDPSLISADWADKRFQRPNLTKLVRKAMGKIIRFDFSSYSLEDESLAPDAGLFYYPKEGGIQAMPDRFAQLVRDAGNDIVTNAHITSVDAETKQLSFELEGVQQQVRAAESIITTIPLHSYAELLANEIPSSVQGSLASLKYMDIIFVLLFIDKERISNDTWLYFPNPAIAFNRAVEFKNWSSCMAPPSQTSLCLDITVTPENEHLWGLSQEDLAAKCIADCETLQLCTADEVADAKVIYVRHAYPVYDLTYREHAEKIIEFIEGFDGVYCAGRTGIFRYQNSDGAIDMGFELARRLLDPHHPHKSLLEHEQQGVSY